MTPEEAVDPPPSPSLLVLIILLTEKCLLRCLSHMCIDSSRVGQEVLVYLDDCADLECFFCCP